MKNFSKGTLERFNLHVLKGRTAFDVFGEMLRELGGDLNRAKSEAHSSRGQYEMRIYLRTLMSYSEAILFQLKQLLMDQADHLQIVVTPNEKLVLDEQSVEMTDDGTLERKTVTNSHARNAKFTLKFIARKLDLAAPNFGDVGWVEYQKAIGKRNDLTHPKYPKDIHVSDAELSTIDAAAEWLDREIAKVMNDWAEKSKALKISNG